MSSTNLHHWTRGRKDVVGKRNEVMEGGWGRWKVQERKKNPVLKSTLHLFDSKHYHELFCVKQFQWLSCQCKSVLMGLRTNLGFIKEQELFPFRSFTLNMTLGTTLFLSRCCDFCIFTIGHNLLTPGKGVVSPLYSLLYLFWVYKLIFTSFLSNFSMQSKWGHHQCWVWGHYFKLSVYILIKNWIVSSNFSQVCFVVGPLSQPRLSKTCYLLYVCK